MKSTKIYNVCFVNVATGEMKVLTVGAQAAAEAMKTAKRMAGVDGGHVIVKRREMTDSLRQSYKHICSELLDGLKTLNISGPDYDEKAASALTIMDSLVNAFFAAPAPVAQIAAPADDTTEKHEEV